jgi:hypothetical protein
MKSVNIGAGFCYLFETRGNYIFGWVGYFLTKFPFSSFLAAFTGGLISGFMGCLISGLMGSCFGCYFLA